MSEKKETIKDAKEELKRIDHLIYVTLKYTRTVDVFLSIIKRMINSYEFIVDALLEKAKEEGKIEEIPDIPLTKANKVLEFYDDKDIKEHIEKYLVFRKLRRSNYEKKNEFRRHVTMSAIIDGKVVEVTIDSVTKEYHSIKDLIEKVTKKYFKEDD